MDHLKYPRVWAAILETAWAILPAKMAEITEFMAYKSAGGQISVEEARERFADGNQKSQPDAPARIGVLPVYGTISQRAGLLSMASGGTSVEEMTQAFRAFITDPDIDAVVMDVDSPGGSVSGLTEFASEIYRARKVKPVIAVANSMMASGAYWLGSAATEIVASPSSKLGSIGVIAAHENQRDAMAKLGVEVSLVSAGKYKAENNPFEPLSEEGRAEIQKRVDESYAMFTRDIAKGRGVSVQTVRDGFGEGRVVGAREAVALGMADRVATIDDVFAGLAKNKRDSGDSSRAATWAVAPSYEEQGRLVAAELDSFAQATRDRIDYRAVDGRGLGTQERDRLVSVRDGIREAATQLDALLAETDPNRERINPLALRGMRSARLVLAGIESEI